MSQIRDQQLAVASSLTQKPSKAGQTVVSYSPTLPGVLHDALVSIDEKLRSLDTFSYTMKLARLDFSLEQLGRRLENIETKLGRMETKFDIRMEKVEEVVLGKDIKEEFSNEQMIRQMDNLNDKFNNKIAFIDAKLDMRLERLSSKLDMIEREVQTSGDDIVERLSKAEDNQNLFESRINGKFAELGSKSWHLDSLKVVLRDELADNVVNRLSAFMEDKLVNKSKPNRNTDLDSLRNETAVSARALQNQSSRIIESLDFLKDNCLELNLSSDNRLRSMLRDYDMVHNNSETKEQIENMTAALQRSLRVNEAKFNQLDHDVEAYSRKVINGMHEVRRSSDQLNGFMADVVQEGNKTRQIIRNDFDKLQEQIRPLSTMEPKFAGVGEDLNKKLYELGAKVDQKFDTLLIAQNTFISSCGRIQEEETQVYEALGEVVREMRNRSEMGMETMTVNLQKHSDYLSKNLDAVLMAILTSSNETAHRIVDLIMTTRRDLVSNCECQESNDIAQIDFNNLRQKSLDGAVEMPVSISDPMLEKPRESNLSAGVSTVDPRFDEFDDLFEGKSSAKHTSASLDYDHDYQMQEAEYVEN